MFEKIQKLLDRVESRIALWQILSGLGAASSFGISAGVAAVTDWLHEYSPASWWFGGLLGLLVFCCSLWLMAKFRWAWAQTRAVAKWAKQADTFNPLEPEFHKLRMNAQQLANPLTLIVQGKKLIDCELIGPGNIFFYRNCDISHVCFSGCEVVVVQPGARIQNAIVFEDVSMYGGTIYRATIFITPDNVGKFRSFGADFITLTGAPEIDKTFVTAPHRHTAL